MPFYNLYSKIIGGTTYTQVEYSCGHLGWLDRSNKTINIKRKLGSYGAVFMFLINIYINNKNIIF